LVPEDVGDRQHLTRPDPLEIELEFTAQALHSQWDFPPQENK
jgi:hypothetical protein